jgi:hypothetical protein
MISWRCGAIRPVRICAAVTGSFSFISDDPGYQPAEPCFDLCVRDGRVASLPTSDKPTLLVHGGKPVIRQVRAQGQLSVGGHIVRWVGSRSSGPLDPGTAEVYGAANCRVRYAAAERTGFWRHVTRAENVTSPDPAVVDAVVRDGPGGQVVAQTCIGGGADLFAGAFILRFRPPVPPALRPGCPVRVTTVDDLDLRKIWAAMSIGPSVADAAHGNDTGYSGFLGNAPFRAGKRYARTLVSLADGALVMQVFDGAPLTRQFQGPTPGELREILAARGRDPGQSFHLDGGGSAKMVIRSDAGPVTLGSLHYLRWPRRPEQEFQWWGLYGRRLHSAVCVRWPGHD